MVMGPESGKSDPQLDGDPLLHVLAFYGPFVRPPVCLSVYLSVDLPICLPLHKIPGCVAVVQCNILSTTVDDINPALPIIRSHNSHRLGFLRHCRIYIINHIMRPCHTS